jgi:hypothetical protein
MIIGKLSMVRVFRANSKYPESLKVYGRQEKNHKDGSSSFKLFALVSLFL